MPKYSKAQCGSLPTTLPTNQIDLAAANAVIACTFAPTIHHMTDNTLPNSHNGVADLIVDLYYDGDQDTRNNWDNLINYDINNPALNPKVYYSVIWGTNHWIVTYAFYHARDYASEIWPCCKDNHENDMEGAVYIINKTTHQRIYGGALSHKNLLTKCNPDNQVFVDDGTHANRIGPNFFSTDCIGDINPCDPCKLFSNPHITYTRGTTSSQSLTRSGTNIFGTATYILEDIFTGNSNGLWSKKLSQPNNVVVGNIFAHAAPANNHDCQDRNVANPPWGWDDQFNHSNDAIMELVTESKMSCGNYAFNIVNNPYSNNSITLCSAPQNLIITNINDYGAYIDWNDVSGASFYRIYYKKSSSTQWEETESVLSNLNLTMLDPNTTYDIRIAASCNTNTLNGSLTTTCIVCSCIKNDVIINSNQTLNVSNITGDIYVKAGYTLTINSLVKFNVGSSIIVEQDAKLIVNGGTLTSCHPNYKWDGIVVWGNPWAVQGIVGNTYITPGGIVEVKGGSIIENAIKGINTSNPTSGGMFGNFNFSGGLVKVENSTLRNCTIAANFGPYGTYRPEDQSFFNNASISDCNYGVKIDNNIGIEFDATTFSTMSQNGIECVNSKIDVDNITINDAGGGVVFFNTWPSVLGSQIVNSTFANEYDIYGNLQAMLHRTLFKIMNLMEG